MSNSLLAKVVLAAGGLIFAWFAIGNLFPAAGNEDELLACAGIGLITAAIIFP